MEKKYIVDGLRFAEKTSESVDSAGVERVHEVHQEVVPMKLTKKVTTKMVQVPVEERIETFGDDGSVDTVVKSVDKSAFALRDHSVEPKLEDVLDRVEKLTGEVMRLNAAQVKDAPLPVIVSREVPETMIDNTIVFDPGLTTKDTPPAHKVVIEEQVPVTEKVVAAVMWGAVGVLGAIFLYNYWPW